MRTGRAWCPARGAWSIHLDRRGCGGECACHAARDYRRAHRPARPEGQTHAERGGGDRLPVWSRLADCPGVEPVVDDLVAAQLIDQVRFTRQPEYVFHHPLIRTVAYESQLKSDRAEMHRRLAAAIEAHEPDSVDENAALIAEHVEAAGDLRAAFNWHMRAATWATNRDIAAARLSWERARKIADALPADDPHRAAMRIAPRTMLCGIAWRVHASRR
jgi:hypothetical protein